MKAGNRGLSKTEGGKTVKMTISTVCSICGKTFTIKSDVPMKDQTVCPDCR